MKENPWLSELKYSDYMKVLKLSKENNQCDINKKMHALSAPSVWQTNFTWHMQETIHTNSNIDTTLGNNNFSKDAPSDG